MNTSLRMDVDNEGKEVDQAKYRGFIGSLFYLTASRPSISFVVGVSARFQSNPKENHLTAKHFTFPQSLQRVNPFSLKTKNLKLSRAFTTNNNGDFLIFN